LEGRTTRNKRETKRCGAHPLLEDRIMADHDHPPTEDAAYGEGEDAHHEEGDVEHHHEEEGGDTHYYVHPPPPQWSYYNGEIWGCSMVNTWRMSALHLAAFHLLIQRYEYAGLGRVPNEQDRSAEKVRAIFDYVAENDDHLSFKVGDLINVLEERDGGWWKGALGDKEGLFPANYVEYLPEEGYEEEEEEEAIEEEEVGLDDAGGMAEGGEEDSSVEAAAVLSPADEREERRRRRQLDLDELETQIEENKAQKLALEVELEQLKRVKEHAQQELTDMGLVRTDIELLVYDLVKIMGELDEESATMNDLQTARQTLQAELNNFSALTSSEIKKGSPLEPFKTEILSKLAQLTLKLTDDDKFIGIYEKKKNTFFFILKAVKDALQNK
jgi:hypothetical protein